MLALGTAVGCGVGHAGCCCGAAAVFVSGSAEYGLLAFVALSGFLSGK